ncbi:MAG TPA: rod shape-determining protein RodA [Lachnospiraceae bacterium]|nr:rod shape-determining protein RodA [Lachnospiraceae bacterium]
MLHQYQLKNYNFILCAALIVLSVIGILLVGSADSSLQGRQMAGVVFGVILMVVVSMIDYNWILHFFWALYGLTLALLLLVLLIGIASHGAARWIEIGSVTLQPTELCKILLILFFADFFMKKEEKLSTWRTIGTAVLLVGVPLVMIYLQPDLKNTITISFIFIAMYFSAGLSYRKILTILAVIVPLALGLFLLITKTDIPIVDDYQKGRIMTFLEPENDQYSETAMQQENSVMAIGSGQITGKGLNNNDVSSVNKGNFVAESQNDFIFAVAGEELGFVGCVFIILLLMLIVILCFRTGIRARNLGGKLFCDGMGALIALQSFINIGVACGILPNTGTTLPFVSYGLTSLISLYIGMGVVLNVGLQKKNKEIAVKLSSGNLYERSFHAIKF